MRINDPVTDNEIHLGTDQTLVSRTNLKGVITYVDHDFIEVSGFSESELLNQDHNMVRHPDMPEEVFQDLWSTLKSGKPWIKLVKNRCKNGDFYWEEANVAPVYEHGRVAGYLSVRRKPTQEQIETARALYADVRAGTSALHERRRFSLLETWSRMTLKVQISIQASAIAMLAILTEVAAVIGDHPLIVAATVIAAVLLVFVLVNWFIRSVLRPLLHVRKTLGDLAEGKFLGPVNIQKHGEMGDLFRGLKSMQIKLSADFEEANNRANKSTRMRQALDNVNTSVIVADGQNEIIYLNDSAIFLFKSIETDIQKELPDFSTDKLLGSNISLFSKNPENNSRSELDQKTNQTGSVEIGGRTLQFVANPVRDTNGGLIGTAVEWTDQTAEISIQDEVQEVVGHALVGDLSRRISVDDKKGFFAVLSKNINELVGIAERVISDAARVLEAVAEGDLNETIDEDFSGLYGKLKYGANTTVAKLSDVVIQLQGAADLVRTGASEIAQGNVDLNRRTEDQAANLERTASSMEQINATVRQNADNAAQANQLAKAARDEANAGGDVVKKAVEAMDTINTSSNRIADIVSVIDEIAFQTNLLALNASVEAARAGEQGRGFAVVAGEVRNLASRSASAAKEIKDLIKDSVEKVNDGSRLVNESGQRLEQIVDGVKKVTDIVGEIAAASQEQATAIDGVNRSVTEMDGLTQQNATLVEQAAAASAQLGQQAQGLSELTQFFKVGQDQVDSAERRNEERPWSGQNPTEEITKNAPDTEKAHSVASNAANQAELRPGAIPGANVKNVANAGGAAPNDQWDAF